MIAVVPAAGRGTRLGELTAHMPKVLVDVAGRPVLRWVVDALAGHVDRVVVVAGHLADQVVAAVAEWEPGVPVEVIIQRRLVGTADAVRTARSLSDGRPFLYAWADVLVPPAVVGDVAALREGDLGVIAVDLVPDVSVGAAVELAGNRVTDVREKPPPGSGAGWNATGVGALPADAWELLEGLSPSPRGEYELTDVLGVLARQGRLRAVQVSGPVFDIGTPERLAAARSAFGSPEGA